MVSSDAILKMDSVKNNQCGEGASMLKKSKFGMKYSEIERQFKVITRP